MIVSFELQESGTGKIVQDKTVNENQRINEPSRRAKTVGELRERVATTGDGKRVLIYFTFANEPTAAPETTEKGATENV